MDLVSGAPRWTFNAEGDMLVQERVDGGLGRSAHLGAVNERPAPTPSNRRLRKAGRCAAQARRMKLRV